MIRGAIAGIAIVFAGAWLNPFGIDPTLRGFDLLGIAISSAMLPALFVAVSIGRLAKHRFFAPADIDGGGLSSNTDEAKVLQALLQNTLEQFALVFGVYLAWAVTMPAASMSVVPLAAIAFAVGRILFFAGYKQGAPSRALGFTLTFYPSLVMLVCIIGRIAFQQLSYLI
jgi:hypothetical protein